LCLSHANDHAPNERMVEISSGLLLTYAIGATAGPLTATLFMQNDNPGGLFVFIAAALGTLALFVVYRLIAAPIVKDGERADFVPVPKTSQSVYSLETDD
ncbi:MAG: hypothetical protein V7703_18730, partial [Hyphomicrobiales bacterium]